MITNTPTRTIAEVDTRTGDFEITCFAAMNDDGTMTPYVYKSRVLDKPMVIDNSSGKEGDLLLSYDGNTTTVLESSGDLILTPDDKDGGEYSVKDSDLNYEE